MSLAVHHLLFAFSCSAVGGSGLRIASRSIGSGLERIIAAAAVSGVIVVLETLALGRVGLGGDSWVLSAAALATWLATSQTVAPSGMRLRDEIGVWWRGLGDGSRLALGTAGGVFAYMAIWGARRPSIGFDPSVYHFSEAIAWVQNGRPGSIVSLSHDYPFGNYPVTNEVFVSWGAALARSFAPMLVWAFASYVLLGAGSWVTLRALRVPTLPRALAVAGVLLFPWVVRELNEPLTDVPALAWMSACAALAFSARARTLNMAADTGSFAEPPWPLMAPAMLAAGLAAGTKTPVILPAAIALGIGFWACRGHLARHRRSLMLAGAAALLVSVPWYLRNLLTHGSPLWPFVALPGGTPVPPMLQLVHSSFLQTISLTLDVDSDRLSTIMAGGLIMLAAALLAPLLGHAGRQRAVLAASAITLVTILMWSAAPTTGVSSNPGIFLPWAWPVSTIRYLLPGEMIAALAVALVTRSSGWARPLALLVLAAAAGWSLVESVQLGPEWIPPTLHLCAAAGIGALAVVALGRVRRLRWVRIVMPAAVGAAIFAVAAAISTGFVGRHFVERHDLTVTTSFGVKPNLIGWFLSQPDFATGNAPVYFVSRVVIAQLAGDHFQHRLVLVPPDAPCASAIALLRKGWVVNTPQEFGYGFVGVRPFPVGLCFKGQIPRYFDGTFFVFRAEPAASSRAYRTSGLRASR